MGRLSSINWLSTVEAFCAIVILWVQYFFAICFGIGFVWCCEELTWLHTYFFYAVNICVLPFFTACYVRKRQTWFFWCKCNIFFASCTPLLLVACFILLDVLQHILNLLSKSFFFWSAVCPCNSKIAQNVEAICQNCAIFLFACVMVRRSLMKSQREVGILQSDCSK